MDTKFQQLELWPGMPGGRCPLCRSKRPTPATCEKCALRLARVTAPPLTWHAERALMRRERVKLAAERTRAERAHTVRLHRLRELRNGLGVRRAVRVALVGCGAKKRPGRHKARDLYTGPLFKAALAHAERTADEVLILSGLHGVVGLDDELDAYNVRLDRYRDAERQQWAYRVLCELAKRYRGLDVELTVYAGAAYVDGLQRAWRMQKLRPRRSTDPALAGWHIAGFDVPLAGLGVGKRLAWFKARAAGDAKEARAAERAAVMAQREAERGQRRAERDAERTRRRAEREARTKRDRQLRRELERRERDRRSDVQSRAAMALEAAEQRAGRGSRVPVHCGGWVAADGVLYSAADYAARDRRGIAAGVEASP